MIVLETCDTRFGTITIFRRDENDCLVYDQDGSSQSETDPAGVSLAPYIHALFDLLEQMRATNVLMIGCGGGTLATMLVRAGRAVTVVDANPESFRLARKYFRMPAEVRCDLADGRDYLLASPETFDAIVVDAFHGAVTPTHLRTQAFLELVSLRLNPGGILLINAHVADDADPEMDRIAELAANVWAEVRVLDASGYSNRNAIVAAGQVRQLQLPRLRLPPAERASEIAYELETLRFRTWASR